MPKPTFQEILKHFPDQKGRDLISRAFEFAQTAHQGQKRFSGEDYIIHPLRVALLLTHLKLDEQTVAAALLHDVLDDTKVLPEDLEKKFGREISFLVKGVSALGKLRLPKQGLEIPPIDKRGKKPTDLEIENLRRMFFAMAEDIRVILIKLADRSHNMETLEFIPKEKQKRVALETLEVFAPLANRLGINSLKTKLENLAFPYLYPKEYQWLKEKLEPRHREGQSYLEKVKLVLKKHLEKEKIPFGEIRGRLKSYFSLYQKLLRYEMDLDRIYDLLALRVIVPDVKSCYEALGAIHQYWRPLPGRVKDYIAFPKPNGYQSLHTTVFCEGGKIIEVQIRTPEMHENSEWGICAHWARKENIDLVHRGQRFSWVQQLAGWQKENQDGKEFLESLKIDFFKNRIFVFTPKGDIIDLPEGACPIDFAYAVHSEIGNQTVGAKVNGKIVALSASLKNGDVVEILVDKNKKPSRDWLKFVKTRLAHSHIKKQTETNLLRGLRDLKEKFFPTLKPLPSPPKPVEKKAVPTAALKTPVIIIAGKPGVAYDLARCCQPKPKLEILAYLARSRGRASLHLQNCPNLKRLKEKFPEKILQAKWS